MLDDFAADESCHRDPPAYKNTVFDLSMNSCGQANLSFDGVTMTETSATYNAMPIFLSEHVILMVTFKISNYLIEEVAVKKNGVQMYRFNFAGG
jgi:hypothetical protein